MQANHLYKVGASQAEEDLQKRRRRKKVADAGSKHKKVYRAPVKLLIDFSVEEVCEWLRAQGAPLDLWATEFEIEDIDGEKLLNMSSKEMKNELGMTDRATRQALKAGIAALQTRDLDEEALAAAREAEERVQAEKDREAREKRRQEKRKRLLNKQAVTRAQRSNTEFQTVNWRTRRLVLPGQQVEQEKIDLAEELMSDEATQKALQEAALAKGDADSGRLALAQLREDRRQTQIRLRELKLQKQAAELKLKREREEAEQRRQQEELLRMRAAHLGIDSLPSSTATPAQDVPSMPPPPPPVPSTAGVNSRGPVKLTLRLRKQ
ncbi:MAG: hypothetical protein MHM6MM_004732 [Cercozoa sp. M6MM]